MKSLTEDQILNLIDGDHLNMGIGHKDGKDGREGKDIEGRGRDNADRNVDGGGGGRGRDNADRGVDGGGGGRGRDNVDRGVDGGGGGRGRDNVDRGVDGGGGGRGRDNADKGVDLNNQLEVADVFGDLWDIYGNNIMF